VLTNYTSAVDRTGRTLCWPPRYDATWTPPKWTDRASADDT